jgi:hypothetical protein
LLSFSSPGETKKRKLSDSDVAANPAPGTECPAKAKVNEGCSWWMCMQYDLPLEKSKPFIDRKAPAK